MEVEVLTQLISNMGFPIACVIAMFYMWNKEREAHKEESEKWMNAFNQNTEALNELKEVIKNDK